MIFFEIHSASFRVTLQLCWINTYEKGLNILPTLKDDEYMTKIHHLLSSKDGTTWWSTGMLPSIAFVRNEWAVKCLVVWRVAWREKYMRIHFVNTHRKTYARRWLKRLGVHLCSSPFTATMTTTTMPTKETMFSIIKSFNESNAQMDRWAQLPIHDFDKTKFVTTSQMRRLPLLDWNITTSWSPS